MLAEEGKRKALAALYAPLENRMVFSKPAFGIVSNYKYVEGLGKEILLENMKYCRDVLKFLPSDPDKPYEDYDCKNMYFSAAKSAGQSVFAKNDKC